MNHPLRWSLILLALVILLPLPCRAAIWIKDFRGAPKDYRLKRNGQPLPIQYYQTLQTGDRLWVEPDHELYLERDDGTVITVKPTDSPYTVQDTGKAPGVLANLAAWAGGWLHTQAETTASLVARGDSQTIMLPLIPAPPARLVAGTRPLSLAWAGGEPPFSVSLQRQMDKIMMVNQSGIHLRRFSSPPLNLIPGAYELTIRDATQQAAFTVEVVTAAILPPAPAGLTPTGADSLKETVYAVWLAAQGEAWLLEAYQRAVLWREQHEPAQWLMESLEKGIRPPSSPAVAPDRQS